MEIRRATEADVEACIAVLASLTEYFTASTHEECRAGLRSGRAWVAEVDGAVVGFVLAEQRYPVSAEVTFAAVRLGSRANGIGSALVAVAETSLVDSGVTTLLAKTLDASADYEPYVATRAFWERRGFVQVDCIDPLPGWEPGNPAAIYVKSLAGIQAGG